MNLSDFRAWTGIGLVAGAIALGRWRREFTPALVGYGLLFLPTANVLFPIGTMMGERLAYLPSAALALALAIALGARPLNRRATFTLLCFVTLVYGARTVTRNLDWRNAETLYSRLVQTSPNSAKAHFFYGTSLASRGDDAAAIVEYDRAIAIFPAYSEAYHNRGNALARLGRNGEAIESYRAALRFDPGDRGAAENLSRLEAGFVVSPPRRRL